jgi:hypothetical protein
MATLATIATVATGVAAVVGAGASVYGGFLARQEAEERAHEYEKMGKQEFAAAQADAVERRLQGQLILSRQQAAAAASGGGAGADAPTIVRLMSETAKRIDYGAQSDMYGGYSRRSTYFTSAANSRRSGANALIGGILDGVGNLLGGAGATVAMADEFDLLPSGPSKRWGWASI